jgi:hypothetical protein
VRDHPKLALSSRSLKRANVFFLSPQFSRAIVTLRDKQGLVRVVCRKQDGPLPQPV